MHHVHVNTAGLHASAAMGLSGRLEFDSILYVEPERQLALEALSFSLGTATPRGH
jgi:hypothetical protein